MRHRAEVLHPTAAGAARALPKAAEAVPAVRAARVRPKAAELAEAVK